MSWRLRLTRRDAVRGAVAGAHGVSAGVAARALFEAGGRRVLPASVQEAVKSAVESQASRVLAVHAGDRMLESGAAAATAIVEGSVARSVVAQTVRGAARQILRGIAASAGAGAAIDGGWALATAVRQVRGDNMTRREAVGHVAREAATGALATAAGTAAAATLVTLTGGVAAPALFMVGAVASVGAKMGLQAWLRDRRMR
ncbi:MAG: hypothetical protein M3O46_07270 [Myxococcota bacterium]|nr:hypothetical protein [Myxococcota bacterium]